MFGTRWSMHDTEGKSKDTSSGALTSRSPQVIKRAVGYVSRFIP